MLSQINMIIREMAICDLDAVLKIHIKAFNGFFLTRMGDHFLRAYYLEALDFENSIALVAEDPKGSHILGFAVGFRNPQVFYAIFRQRCKQIWPTILFAVMRDPGLVPLILNNMIRLGPHAQQTLGAVELSSIAVNVPGNGVGSELLKAFTKGAQTEKERKIMLKTDAEGNDYVRRFYEAHGFKLESIERRGKRQLCCYLLELG